MQQVIAFLAAHPELWPFYLALLTALFSFVSRWPRGKAVVDALKAVGFDPAGLLDALKRVVTGKLPPVAEAKPEPKVDSEKSE